MDPYLLQTVAKGDQWLFAKINGEWVNPVLDAVLPMLTDLNHQPWFPVVIIAILVLWAAKQRYRAMIWILTLLISVGVSDFVSYRVIKSTVDRARPEASGIPVVLRTTHHSGSSFPSNHAANAFAGASVLSSAFPVGTPLFFLLAALVAYSRVYVGVHFPIDVIGGAFLGWSIAFATKILLRNQITKAELSEQNRFEQNEQSEANSRRTQLLRKRKP